LELAQDFVQLRALVSAVLRFLIGFAVIGRGFGYLFYISIYDSVLTG
jgi:hypothetical protein